MADAGLSIAFRCNGAPDAGLGHLIRSSALADAVRAAGAAPVFVVAADSRMAAERLQRAGFRVEQGAEHDRGPLSAEDAARDAAAARRCRASVMVVDHYGAGADYLATVAAQITLGVLDDLADRDLRAAAWVLNQNIAAADLAYETAPGCELLTGVDWALLRPEFSQARRGLEARQADEDLRRILVTFGGSPDPALCIAVLGALDDFSEVREILIVAGASGASDELAAAARASHHDVDVVSDPDRMSDLMLWADVAISAAGSTCLELLCLGVPIAAVALSRDQEPNLQALATNDLGVPIARPDRASIADALQSLLDGRRRAELSARGMQLVDGRGAERAAASLLSLAGRAGAGT